MLAVDLGELNMTAYLRSESRGWSPLKAVLVIPPGRAEAGVLWPEGQASLCPSSVSMSETAEHGLPHSVPVTWESFRATLVALGSCGGNCRV